MSNPKTARAEAGAQSSDSKPAEDRAAALQDLVATGNATEEELRAAGYTTEEIKSVATKLRRVEQLAPVRMQDAEFGRMEKVCVAHENTLPQDLLRQDYWAHVAQDLRPWARIEVRANDGTWLWEGVVLEAGRNWANVRELHLHQFTTKDMAQTNAAIQAEYAGMPYEVRYRGEFELWSVVRKSDDAVMHEKEATKNGADTWLRERLKADRR